MAEQIHEPENAGAPADPQRLFIAFRRKRWSIAGATLFGAVAGAVVAKTMIDPVFEARSVIECDRCSRPDMGDRELATLQESVKLPQHLENAREKLGLTSELDTLERDVEVGASIESRLIHVTARGKNGELAAGLANETVDAFWNTRLQVERDKLDDRVRRLLNDAEKARAAIILSRERYDRFRNENDFTDLSLEREAAIQEAARLRGELAIAQGDEQGERARVLSLRFASGKEPSTVILTETEDLPYVRRLAEAKAKLTSARARLSADHPEVQALTAEVETIERIGPAVNEAFKTGQVIGRGPQRDLALSGIVEATANQEAAKTRQLTYEKLAQRATQAVARLSSIEGQASELLSNLQIAERHASTIELDLKIAEDAARAPSTGLRILATARAPSIPVRSSRKVVAILAPFVALVIAALVTLWQELRGFRIQTATELAFWGKGPVLASSRWPTSTEALGDLVSDVVSALRGSKGKTLLLGAGTMEMALVQPLAHNIREQIERESAGDESSHGSIEPFEQLESIATLRRAVHRCDQVIILVGAGRHSAFAFRTFIEKIARPRHIAFVLVDLHEDHVALPDLVGKIDAFRNSSPEDSVNAEQSLPSA